MVYTPEWTVDLMLDALFSHHPLTLTSVAFDPACGDGAFLRGLTRRAISEASRWQISPAETSSFVERLVNGADIDASALASCKTSLDEILREAGIPPVNWNLWNGDSLSSNSGISFLSGQCSHIVANPPYIRIQDLDPPQRKNLQEQFQFCRKGSTDIFLAFFEFSLKFLAPGGHLAFINSRSFFDSSAASDFRRYVAERCLLREIIDFGEDQVFPEVTTYTAVTVLAKDGLQKSGSVRLSRFEVETMTTQWDSLVSLEHFGGDRWHVSTSEDIGFIKTMESRGPSLSDICAIRVGLATLRDKVYVCHLLNDDWENQETSTCLVRSFDGRNYQIEKSALRRVVKVSTLKTDDFDQRLAIIFPYFSDEGSPLPWNKHHQEINQRAMSYLSTHRETLEGRGHDVRTWFEYGSTQGISSLFGKKILIPSMTESGRVFLWTRAEFTFFSGYAIFFEGDIEKLHDRLTQDDFQRYAKLCGRTLRGGWFSMTKSSLSRFSLPHEEWIDLGVSPDRIPNRLFDA